MTTTRTLWIGLVFSLFGAGLIRVGDGGESLFREGIVVSGLVFTISGLGILRYLLFANKKLLSRRY